MSQPKQVKNLIPTDITLVKNTIHNPAEPRHFLKLKPILRQIRILYKGQVIAETTNALRVLEVGQDMYDPAIYLPRASLQAKLRFNENTSHCPLKGDAQYFDLVDKNDDFIEQNIAWSYIIPFDFVDGIKGLVSFYTDRVTIEEAPL